MSVAGSAHRVDAATDHDFSKYSADSYNPNHLFSSFVYCHHHLLTFNLFCLHFFRENIDHFLPIITTRFFKTRFHFCFIRADYHAYTHHGPQNVTCSLYLTSGTVCDLDAILDNRFYRFLRHCFLLHGTAANS